MKFLFIHQNFPGQFLHILNHLSKNPDHELVFISQSNQNHIKGVRRAIYRMPVKPHRLESVHPAANEFDLAVTRAELIAQSARTLKNLGFVPDIIIGHQGWGELLNISDVYPHVPVLGYFEFFYHSDRYDVGFDKEFPMGVELLSHVRAKNAVNLLALDNPGKGITPTRFQWTTYPEWAREKITILPEGVDLQKCQPDPKLSKKSFTLGSMTISPKTKLVTYVARNLEPYRGFHSFMRALPHIMRDRPDIEVAIVGGDEVSYGARLQHGTWRDMMLKEVGDQLDLERVHFLGILPYNDFCRLLQRSDAHIYLTYPFVLSWSLREALACGCAIVASATEPVEEFITDGENGLLAPFDAPEKIAETTLSLLDDQKLQARLRRNARVFAEKNLDMKTYLQEFENLIKKMVSDAKVNRKSSDSKPSVKSSGTVKSKSSKSKTATATSSRLQDRGAQTDQPSRSKKSSKLKVK